MSSNNLNLNEYDENMKLGEIRLKNNKYYFIPNRKDDMNEINGEELFAWFIFKGKKYPMTKNKYKIREGDILKLGRVWLIVRAIHIPQKKLERKNTNCLISFHSKINESLNVNKDFREENEFYKNLIEDGDSSITSEEENEEDENDLDNKNKTNNINSSPQKNEEEKNNIISKHKKKKDNYYNPKIINVKRKEKINFDSKKLEKQKICRICYMAETNSIINPLIKPCKCSGSMKYIHLKCLLQWLKTKIQVDKSEYIENNYFTLYSSEKVECELCKQIFPHYIKHKHKLYNLMDLDLNFEIDKKNKNKNKLNNLNYTDGDNVKKNKEKKDYENINNDDSNAYIVFDTIPFDKTIPAYIYLAKFDKNNKLKIGRGLEMNLIMNDLSISRNHCQLELTEDGDILLQDNNSKFGTLILIQAKEMEILKGQTLTIQVGRSFFNINYKKDISLFNCCQAEVIDKRKTYEDMNYRAIKITNNSIILTESASEGSDNDEENKNGENEYEKIIKNVNNKKINILKISRKKKDKKEENDLKAIKDIKINDENNNEQKDKINNDNINNKDNLFINEEQEKQVNNNIKDNEDKKVNENELIEENNKI